MSKSINYYLDLNIRQKNMQFKLSQHIVQALSLTKQAQKTNHIYYQIPITLLLLQKKDVMYVTDGHVIVQALMCLTKQAKQNRDDYPKPFNIIRTNYYNFSAKCCNLFMFNQQDCYQTKFPSVYHPTFHFSQDKILEYKKENGVQGFDSLNQVLVINQWGFRIVNIANTGYYGFVLEICNYQRMRLKFKVNKNIHSVLYEKSIVFILEELRIKDMREQIGIPKKDNQISLCYYRKNLRTTRNSKIHKSSFVNADRSCRYIKFNPQIRQNYIPLGDLSGALRFIRPLVNFTENKKAIMNFNLFQPKQAHQSQIQQDQNESQKSESSEQVEENITVSDQDSEQPQSSQDQEEPLKLIYHKQLQKINII